MTKQEIATLKAIEGKQVYIYVFTPEAKTNRQIEFLQLRANSKLIASVETGVIYPDFETANQEILSKNKALANARN